MADNFKCAKCGMHNPFCEAYFDRLQVAEAHIEKLLEALKDARAVIRD